jgi:GST-like protein
MNETNRLYGVLNKRLADREFIAGDYSIADMASYPCGAVEEPEPEHRRLSDLKRWLETIRERPPVRAYAKAKEVNPNYGQPVNRTEEERKILFGQTAAVVRYHHRHCERSDLSAVAEERRRKQSTSSLGKNGLLRRCSSRRRS